MMASALTEAWRGMGIFKWPIAGLIVLGLAIAPLTGPPNPAWVDNGAQDFAGGSVRLKTKGRLGGNGSLDLRLHVQGVPVGRGRIQLLGGEEAPIAFVPQAEESIVEVSLKAPTKVDRIQVSLSMTLSSGRHHRATWDLGPPLLF